MNHKIIGRLILSNILEMSIAKYLNYVDKFITITSKAPFYRVYHINERILTRVANGITGVVVREEEGFGFYSPEYVKFDFELLEEPSDIKWKHSMNWIKTKNLFIHHIVTTLLELQRNFFETHDQKTMIPISLKEFSEEYQFPYLDISRLSRVVNNTWISFHNDKYLLKDLFWNRGRVYASIIENVISQRSCGIKDRGIQEIIKKDYDIDLSIRTVCNYRNSVHIPAYNKINLNDLYGNYFSKFIPLKNNIVHLIPGNAGVYEISVIRHIKYPKLASGVIYYGRSKNLLRRIRNYLYSNIKNSIIEGYREFQEMFIRYYTTPKYIQVERELLERFFVQYGSLPIANKLPKRK